MPMPARTLKTFLRFMLEALHTRDQSPCDLPGHRSFEKTLVGPYLHDRPWWLVWRAAPTWLRQNCLWDMHRFALSLIHISEPTRLGMISYAVFCLKKKKRIK